MGDYLTWDDVVREDDGLSLWFCADSGCRSLSSWLLYRNRFRMTKCEVTCVRHGYRRWWHRLIPWIGETSWEVGVGEFLDEWGHR